ncbi:MAG: hypothetical protein MPJ78_04475 [Hyphomicrobiaceae bacterium]|nr:hypothetical protein [Hyphomicrobiaceae bacterium]
MGVENIGVGFLIMAAAIFAFALIKAYFGLRHLEKQSELNKKTRVKQMLEMAERLPPNNPAKNLLQEHAKKLSNKQLARGAYTGDEGVIA